VKKPLFPPLGWEIEQRRRFRGVDARSLPRLTTVQSILRFLYLCTFPLRKMRGAVMRLAQRGP
jgi:hypothetical protein